MTNNIEVSIVGGSGYAGGELLRLLLGHPNVTIKQITSNSYSRYPVSIVHPNLRECTDLAFCAVEDLEKCDLLILALPNGESQKSIEKYMSLADKVIDLGADYRLNTNESYEKWYGEHQSSDWLGKFVYGIAELHREELMDAQYVACGGCEATCSILTLYPLVKHGLIDTSKIIIDAKIGSSATGSKPSLSSHHPIRSGVVRSYKPTGHRHTAEIEQELGLFTSGDKPTVYVSATAIEMVRGILVTCQTFLNDGVETADVWNAYRQEYDNEHFIRLIDDKIGMYRFPEPKLLEGTNYCDIGMEKEKGSNRLVVIGAIDNLVKGTAGQAIQAMNLMYGFEERTALNFTGLHPI